MLATLPDHDKAPVLASSDQTPRTPLPNPITVATFPERPSINPFAGMAASRFVV